MNEDPELSALSTVCNALKELESESQQRVIDYVARKFGLIRMGPPVSSEPRVPRDDAAPPESSFEDFRQDPVHDSSDAMDGISPVARKWMQRNGLTVDQLGHLFSLGTDEIDLVAQSVSGTSKKARTRSVTLLKGIAAYLSSGVARITAEQIKEACLHYDAFDSPNHSRYLKSMSTELSGNKSSGYTLTSRGITAGTELVQEILGT